MNESDDDVKFAQGKSFHITDELIDKIHRESHILNNIKYGNWTRDKSEEVYDYNDARLQFDAPRRSDWADEKSAIKLYLEAFFKSDK